MAEVVSAADALQKSLDAEVVERLALEAAVASACEGLGLKQAHRGLLWRDASRICTPGLGRGCGTPSMLG